MGETLPASANADYFDVVVARAIHNVLDDSVEAWDVAAAGQDTNAPGCQFILLYGRGFDSL
jgi:hypothetical protein